MSPQGPVTMTDQRHTFTAKVTVQYGGSAAVARQALEEALVGLSLNEVIPGAWVPDATVLGVAEAEQPNLRRYLDLHTRHLPAGMVDELTAFEGLTADVGRYGVWCWVPPNPRAYFEDNYPEVPDELVLVLDYARTLGCDYVRFDGDGPADAFLPLFDA